MEREGVNLAAGLGHPGAVKRRARVRMARHQPNADCREAVTARASARERSLTDGAILCPGTGGYRRWVMSSQGAWVVAALFFAIALMNVASGVWWLAALMAVVGIVNVRRALSRQNQGRNRL